MPAKDAALSPGTAVFNCAACKREPRRNDAIQDERQGFDHCDVVQKLISKSASGQLKSLIDCFLSVFAVDLQHFRIEANLLLGNMLSVQHMAREDVVCFISPHNMSILAFGLWHALSLKKH